MLYWSRLLFFLLGLYFGLVLTINNTLSLKIDYQRVIKYFGLIFISSVISMVTASTFVHLLINIPFMLAVARLALKINYKKLTIPFLICISLYSIIISTLSVLLNVFDLLNYVTESSIAYMLVYSLLGPILSFGVFQFAKRYIENYFLLDMIDAFDNKIYNFIVVFLSILLTISIFSNPLYLSISGYAINNTVLAFSVSMSAFFLFNITFLYILFKNYMDRFLLEIKNQSLTENMENITSLNKDLRSLKHDFGNHLQVISGLLQLKKYSECLSYIMSVNKPHDEGPSVKTGLISVNALLNSKVLRARQKNIKMDINISSHLDTNTFKVEDWEITKVLGNLIDNAIYEESKVSTYSKYIKVNIDEVDEFYSFSVHNKNSYIGHDRKHSIFRSGFSTKGSDGSGMGLYIVKNIVSKYRGTIDLDSNISSGTTFSIYFPKNNPTSPTNNTIRCYPPQESALKAM